MTIESILGRKPRITHMWQLRADRVWPLRVNLVPLRVNLVPLRVETLSYGDIEGQS